MFRGKASLAAHACGLLFVCWAAILGAALIPSWKAQGGGTLELNLPEVESSAIIFPPAGSHVRAGKVLIIGRDRGIPFSVSGVSYLWQFRHKGIAASEVELSAGKHEIRCGKFRQLFTAVGAADCLAAGEGSSNRDEVSAEMIRWHPMKASAESCLSCHRSNGQSGGSQWPTVPTPDACFPCHTPIKLEVIHAHPMEHLYHCQDCHHMHAAPKKHLLTKPAKQLCQACHEA